MAGKKAVKKPVAKKVTTKATAKKTATKKSPIKVTATVRNGKKMVTGEAVSVKVNVGKGAPKSRLVTALLAIFLGTLGIHNFYLGKNNLGLTQLLISVVGGILTCGIATVIVQIWAFIEGILILTKSPGFTKDADGVPLCD